MMIAPFGKPTELPQWIMSAFESSSLSDRAAHKARWAARYIQKYRAAQDYFYMYIPLNDIEKTCENRDWYNMLSRNSAKCLVILVKDNQSTIIVAHTDEIIQNHLQSLLSVHISRTPADKLSLTLDQKIVRRWINDMYLSVPVINDTLIPKHIETIRKRWKYEFQQKMPEDLVDFASVMFRANAWFGEG